MLTAVCARAELAVEELGAPVGPTALAPVGRRRRLRDGGRLEACRGPGPPRSPGRCRCAGSATRRPAPGSGAGVLHHADHRVRVVQRPASGPRCGRRGRPELRSAASRSPRRARRATAWQGRPPRLPRGRSLPTSPSHPPARGRDKPVCKRPLRRAWPVASRFGVTSRPLPWRRAPFAARWSIPAGGSEWRRTAVPEALP